MKINKNSDDEAQALILLNTLKVFDCGIQTSKAIWELKRGTKLLAGKSAWERMLRTFA